MIRRIRPDEGSRLRTLRLRALADAPMAFGSTLARESTFTDAAWQERAQRGASGADGVTFVAELEGEWVGIVTGLPRDPDAPEDPRAVLVGMFVSGEARGHGVGAALVDAVVGWARQRKAEGLGLWVTATNATAIALYRRCGFQSRDERRPLPHTPSVEMLRMVRDRL
jgi:GNAT superfamily N-acetyltransferase